MLERRKFLTALTATMATAAIPTGVIAATLRPQDALRDQLTKLVNRNVRLVDADGVAQTAQLIALDDGPDYPGLEQFSIVFEGADLAEGLYEIRDWRTGRLRITLMSSGEPGAANVRQRAYFSNFV